MEVRWSILIYSQVKSLINGAKAQPKGEKKQHKTPSYGMESEKYGHFQGPLISHFMFVDIDMMPS